MFEIPRVPVEKKLNEQEPYLRKKRLADWFNQLSKMPHCVCLKNHEGLQIECDYVLNNQKLFDRAIFIFRVNDVMHYHETDFVVAYFCFLNDASFKIEIDSFYSSALDSNADYLISLSKLGRKSWQEGYDLIMSEILPEIFRDEIPRLKK